MRRLVALVVIALLLALPRPAAAQQWGNTVFCNQAASYSASVSGTTQIVPAPIGGSIAICGFWFATASAGSVELVAGTGSNCANNAVTIVPTVTFAASSTGLSYISITAPNFVGLITPPGDELCVSTSSSVSISGQVFYYAQR